MAGKILSVEIGNSITRVCEMDSRVKNPKVYKYFCIPTPQGAIEDGFVRENAEFVAAMRRALSANKITTKQVVFSVTSSKIVTRDVMIPSIKINQVGSYIKANANDYFPIDLSMYELAHVLLGSETDEEGKEKMRVMVMAAGKDLISDYARFATECGLRFVSLDYSGNSVYQIMRNECGNETTLVVKVEDSATIATVISNGDLLLQRNIAYGIDRACNALMDSQEHYVGTYTEAFNTACQKPCIKVALNDRTRIMEKDDVLNETEAESDARFVITKTFSQLIGNLARLIELHNTKAVGNSISQVLLIGIGAEVQNLSKLFTNELGIPTRVVKNLSGASINISSVDEEAIVGRYVGAIGAAIAPVDLTLSDKSNKSKVKINYGKLAVLVGVLSVVIAGAMIIMSLLPYRAAKEKEANLRAQEAQYAEAEPIYHRYVDLSALYLEVINKDRMTEHSNDGIVAFFAELEEKLPADAVVKEIVSDQESVRISFTATELEQVAKILQILRDFDTVMDVSLGDSAKEAESDKTDSGITFQAVCYYYPIELEESIEEIHFADLEETGGTDEE